MRALALVALVLTGVACGGSDGGGDRDAAVDALVQGLRDDGDASISDEDVDCVAAAVVDAVGADRLEEAGVIEDPSVLDGGLEAAGVEVSQDEADDLAARFDDCEIDASGLLIEQLTAAVPGAELSEEAAGCLSEQFRAGFGPAFAAAVIRGEDQAQAEGEQFTLTAIGSCPGALTELLVFGIEQQGVTVSAEAQDCLLGEVERRGPEVAGDFLAASSDPALAERFGTELVAPCAELIEG